MLVHLKGGDSVADHNPPDRLPHSLFMQSSALSSEGGCGKCRAVVCVPLDVQGAVLALVVRQLNTNLSSLFPQGSAVSREGACVACRGVACVILDVQGVN